MSNDKRQRLIQLLGMLGSAHDGERLNAARLAQRTLGEMGLTWEEFCGGGNGERGDSKSYMSGYNDGYRQGYDKARRESTVARAKPQTWTAFARALQSQHWNDLSDWEQGFIDSFIERGFATPTPKQRWVFERIAAKCHVELPE